MANNKSIQILRGSQNYDPSNINEQLLDGQPFYSKKNGQLYIGDSSKKDSEGNLITKPVGAANLVPGEGLDSVVQIYSGDVDSTHYDNTNTGEGAVVFGEANNNSANRAVVWGKLNINAGQNIVGGLRNNVAGAQNIVAGQQNGGIGTTYDSATRTATKSTNIKNSLIVGQLHKIDSVENNKQVANSIIAGISNTNTGSQIIQAGHSNTNNQDHIILAGANNEVYNYLARDDSTSSSSIVGGIGNKLYSTACIMAGYGNTIEKLSGHSIIAGLSNKIKESSSRGIVYGYFNIKSGDDKLVGGRYNSDKGESTLLEIGKGTSDTNRSNAFEVLRDGRAKVYKAPQDNEDVVRKLELDKKIVKVAADVMIATKNTTLFMNLSKQFANGEIVIIGTMQGHNIVVNDVRYDQANNTARWIVDFATFDGFTSAGGNGFGNAIFIIDCSDNKFTLIQRFIPQLNFENGTGTGSIVQKLTGMAGDATDEMANINSGDYAAVFGHNNTNSIDGALVAGYYNDKQVTNALLQVGNGTSKEPKNAFTVLKSGKVLGGITTEINDSNLTLTTKGYVEDYVDLEVNEQLAQIFPKNIGCGPSRPVYFDERSISIKACNFEVI